MVVKVTYEKGCHRMCHVQMCEAVQQNFLVCADEFLCKTVWEW